MALAVAPQGPKPLERGPIALYDRACANCHGPNGSFYGPELGQGKTDAQLYQAVQDMADNQGQIALTPAEVEAVTAYHRAIIKKEPFVAITGRTRTELRGEVMKGSTVSVTVAGKAVPVSLSGTTWRATLSRSGALCVTVQRKGATTRLDPDRAAHSHPAPAVPAPPHSL